MLNNITLMGRLVRDPEMRRTQSNKAVASFSMAVERDFNDQATGEKATDFIDLVAWGNTAEFLGKYFIKGQMICVKGRLQTRTWEDRDNNKRKAVEVVAEHIYFADSKKESAGASSGANRAPVNADPFAGEFTVVNSGDDDLPF